MLLPKWLQGSKQVIVHKKGGTKPPPTKPVQCIRPEDKVVPEDKVLFTGHKRSIQIMQEMMDVGGYGRTRQFDADAKGGRSGGYRKGSKRLTQAERQAAAIANSIE